MSKPVVYLQEIEKVGDVVETLQVLFFITLILQAS